MGKKKGKSQKINKDHQKNIQENAFKKLMDEVNSKGKKEGAS